MDERLWRVTPGVRHRRGKFLLELPHEFPPAQGTRVPAELRQRRVRHAHRTALLPEAKDEVIVPRAAQILAQRAGRLVGLPPEEHRRLRDVIDALDRKPAGAREEHLLEPGDSPSDLPPGLINNGTMPETQGFARVTHKRSRHAAQGMRAIPVIRIQPADHVAGGHAKSLVDRRGGAPVRFGNNMRQAGAMPLHDLQRTIRAGAIHDEVLDLDFGAGLRLHAEEGFFQEPFAVTIRSNNGDSHDGKACATPQ